MKKWSTVSCSVDIVRHALSKYNALLAKQPLRTKIATGGTLATSADVLSQSWEPEKPFDFRRSLAMFVFGTTYAGGFQHYLFGFYGRMWPVMQAKPRSERVIAAVKTTAFQQLVTAPFIYFPAFIGITSTVRGDDPFVQWDKHFWPNFKVNLAVWTPALLIQFLFVPGRW
jgi:hypothetical protein